MRKKKSRKGKSLRSRLIALGPLTCFYCGLPFGAFILPKGSPGAAKSRRFACITLEHLVARSHDGDTKKENCVLAHGWCNSTASNRLLADKLLLKEALSNNDGLPPWWPLLQKIIVKESI
jgi:hypothetical protein